MDASVSAAFRDQLGDRRRQIAAALERLGEAVLRDSYRFGGGPRKDDLTLLILRREI